MTGTRRDRIFDIDRVLALAGRRPARTLLVSALLGHGAVAEARDYACYGKDYGPTSRTPIDRTRWDCTAPGDPCCLTPKPDDVDEDSDTVPARCDPDDHDSDDDGDGLPTAFEDLNGDGSVFDDTDRRSPEGAATPAFLDPGSPLDDDSDGFCDCAYAAEVARVPDFCTSFDDCMDFLQTAHPGAAEVWDSERWDDDCLGPNDDDLDGDGYLSTEHLDTGRDCDDADSGVHPGVVEDEGPVDRDCDHFSDPANPLEPTGGCGCDASPAPSLVWLALLLAGPLARRRR